MPNRRPPGIHTDQGYDDEIQPSRRDRAVQAFRHGDPEHAAPSPGVERIEAYSTMPPVDDHGHIDPYPAAARRTDQGGSVRLTVEWQIERDALAGPEGPQPGDRPGGQIRAVSCARQRSRSAAARADVYVASLSSNGDGATRRCRFGPLLPMPAQQVGLTAALKAFRSRRTCTMMPASNGPWGLKLRVER